jgi:hypothetical protein
MSLREVVFGEGIEYIASNAWNGCGNIESVRIPASVKRVEGYAFFDCQKLKSVVFAETEGWRMAEKNSFEGGTPIDVSDPSVNIQYFLTWKYLYRE